MNCKNCGRPIFREGDTWLHVHDKFAGCYCTEEGGWPAESPPPTYAEPETTT